jgi:hypothetical protein
MKKVGIMAIGWIVILITMAVSSVAVAQDKSQSVKEPPLMTFSWPSSGKVRVIELTPKKGTSGKGVL